MLQTKKNISIIRKFGAYNHPNIDFGVKVVVNQQTASGKGGLLWPEILRKLYLLYRYFDYEFTNSTGDAIKITKRALQEGYTTILVIGGKSTIREVIQGFYNKDSRLINKRARLILFPLTFGLIADILPNNAQNWDFLYHIAEGKSFYYQPYFIYLLDSGGRKVRYSQHIFFDDLFIQSNTPDRLGQAKDKFSAFRRNYIEFPKMDIFESRILINESGPLNILTHWMSVHRGINSPLGFDNSLQLKLGIKTSDLGKFFCHRASFFSYKELDKIKIEFYERAYLKIDGVWDDAFGMVINPMQEKIRMHWLLYS